MNTITIDTVAALIAASVASDKAVEGAKVDAKVRLIAACTGAFQLNEQGVSIKDIAAGVSLSTASVHHYVETGRFLSLPGVFEPADAISFAHGVKTLVANACKLQGVGIPKVRAAIQGAKDQPAAAKAIASLAKGAKAAKADESTTDESTTEGDDVTTVVVDDFTAALAKAADAIKLAMANAPVQWSDSDRANVQTVTDLAALLAMASVKVEVAA